MIPCALNVLLVTTFQVNQAAYYLYSIMRSQGVLPDKEVGGGGGGAWTSHQVWRQNLGQSPAKFTKQEEKHGKFCHHNPEKLGKSSIILGSYLKFRGQNTYIFGGKIWGSNKNFRGKFWGQALRPPNMEVPPWECTGPNHIRISRHFVKSFLCCSEVWKGHDDDLFDGPFSACTCHEIPKFVLILCYFKLLINRAGAKAIFFCLIVKLH